MHDCGSPKECELAAELEKMLNAVSLENRTVIAMIGETMKTGETHSVMAMHFKDLGWAMQVITDCLNGTLTRAKQEIPREVYITLVKSMMSQLQPHVLEIFPPEVAKSFATIETQLEMMKAGTTTKH